MDLRALYLERVKPRPDPSKAGPLSVVLFVRELTSKRLVYDLRAFLEVETKELLGQGGVG